MKRRGFIKKLPLVASAPFFINGIPMNLFAKNSQLNKLAANANGDNVVVLIQLHGGNDGLNTLIPIEQYSEYINLRPNLAIQDNGSRKYIPLDNSLALADQLGLHPDMVGIKSLYDEGKASIIQGVSYQNINQSHFRSRDIWFMGGDYDDHIGSGWMGRYLDHEYPNYPEAYPTAEMPDPLGIEIGNGVSLAFHRASGIPTSISINNPNQFHNLIKGVGGDPPESVANTHYGKELQYIIEIEQKSNEYADRLKEVFDNGKNSGNVTYPEKYPYNAPARFLTNGLSSQLKLIARLLSGGSKTKIFLARIGGFDTHANQVESYDHSMGSHAALLYHISSAVKAFQDDLKGLGLEDRVATMTFSEFGRRPASNGGYGTDHGTAAPMFIFGKHVKPGVIGTNPDLNDLERGNLRMQHDYRQVFTSVIQDWLGASNEAVSHTLFDSYQDKKLDLFQNTVTSTRESFMNNRFRLNSCFPNPASSTVTFSYYINNATLVKLSLFDSMGKKIKELVNALKPAGEHSFVEDISALKPGNYIYKIEAGPLNTAKQLIVRR